MHKKCRKPSGLQHMKGQNIRRVVYADISSGTAGGGSLDWWLANAIIWSSIAEHVKDVFDVLRISGASKQ